MKIIIKSLIFTLPIIFCSCDYYSTSSLINSTENNIYIEIQYDKDSIIKYWGNVSFYSLFVDEDIEKEKFIKVDTLNLIIDVKVIPKDTFEIETNHGKKPKFDYVKNIKIFGNDTILLLNREKMTKSFRKVKNGKFIFDIK